MTQRTSHEPGTPCWVDLGTPDIPAARDFYGGLFGWSFDDQVPDAGGYTMCLLRGLPVAGLGPQMNPDGPPWWTCYLAVADCDATAGAVTAAGGSLVVPPIDVLDVGRMAIAADPAGAVFALWQARAHGGAGLTDEPGSVTWFELACRDVEAAKAFYGAVFGWGSRTSVTPLSSYTEWLAGGRPVAGMLQMDERWPEHVPAHWMPYFAVEDCDAAATRVGGLGGAVPVAPMDIEPGRFCMAADPAGAHFYLIALKPMG